MKDEHPEADWATVHRHLAESVTRLKGNQEMPPEQARELLEKRALELAQEADSEVTRKTLEVIIFTVGRERYALETRFVREVRRLNDFTPLPGAPELFYGITNLRSEVLLLMDLRKILGAQVTGLSNFPLIVVLGEDRPELGLLADTTLDVSPLAVDSILDPRASLGEHARLHLYGVTPDGLQVLNGAHLLADERLILDQESDA